MKPTEDLMNEHKAIKKMLSIMKKIAGHISAGNPADPDDLDQIIEFLKVFADKCHHGKEETALFPAMVSAGLPEKSGPIAVMLHDHAIGRKMTLDIETAVNGFRNGNYIQPLADRLVDYVNHLTAHILKEDSILFPMADRILGEDKQTEINFRFHKIEKEVIGPGIHEQFHALLDRLDNKY